MYILTYPAVRGSASLNLDRCFWFASHAVHVSPVDVVDAGPTYLHGRYKYAVTYKGADEESKFVRSDVYP